MTTILTNSNLYLGASQFGKVKKFTTPEVEIKTEEIQTGYGNYNLPTGINALTASFEMLCIDETVFQKISNPFEEVNMTVYGSLSVFNNETLKSEKQAKLILRGSLSKKSLLGELEPQAMAAYTVDMNISAYKLEVSGSTWEQVDIPNLIWTINGVDVYKKLKSNLGIS